MAEAEDVTAKQRIAVVMGNKRRFASSQHVDARWLVTYWCVDI
jgi:hypothetical protein